MATASLILGIFSVLLIVWRVLPVPNVGVIDLTIAAIIAGIAGLVLGILSLKRSKSRRRIAIAGIGLSSLTILAFTVFIVLLAIFWSSL